MEPVYFVVQRRAGREIPTIIVDQVPASLKRNIVYQLRLDRLPNADYWLKMTTPELYRTYCYMRDRNSLPVDKPDEKPKADPARRQLGEYWEPPAKTWPDRPAELWGAAGLVVVVDGKLVPAAEAPAIAQMASGDPPGGQPLRAFSGWCPARQGPCPSPEICWPNGAKSAEGCADDGRSIFLKP